MKNRILNAYHRLRTALGKRLRLTKQTTDVVHVSPRNHALPSELTMPPRTLAPLAELLAEQRGQPLVEPLLLEAPTYFYDETDVMSGSVRIHAGRWTVRVNGAESKRTALLVHGLSANHVCWKTIAEMLQRHGISSVAVDLRGRGKSDKPRGEYGFAAHCEDLRAVVQQLGLNAPGREKPIVIGHSLGAVIGMNFAWRHPEFVHKLVMIDAGAPLSIPNQIKAYFTIRGSVSRLGKEYADAEAYVDRMKALPLLQPWNDTVEQYVRYDIEDAGGGKVRSRVPPYVIEAEYNSIGSSLNPLTILKNNTFHPIRQVKKVLTSRVLNFPYQELRMPVQAIGAGKFNLREGDELLPPSALQYLRERIPNCTTYTVPAANHYTVVFADFPDRDAAIVRFIEA
jgi:pimeloyl-ACP methyl ester carboxylesterase